jgi:plasmid stabilization system protein ParE
MSVRKSADFIADVERQYRWYLENANEALAEGYLAAIEATCILLGQHPRLGPLGGFIHPRLRGWRFLVAFRPFNKHVLFYEIAGEDAVMRRAMHGHRDLPQRLLEPPRTS